ncbi:MAG: DUF4215 domain-containing protein [Myxococcota bacterium]
MACYGAPFDDYPLDGECGDGRVDRFEACDDGNTIGGDGCPPQCELEASEGPPPPPPPPRCLAEPLAQEGPTVGVTSSLAQPAPCEATRSTAGAAYSFDAVEPGYLEVIATGEQGVGLYLSDLCPGTGNLLDTTDRAGEPSCQPVAPVATVRAAVGPGRTYVTVVTATDSEAHSLRHSFTPACGDGETQAWASETCDDGNRDAGDGCDTQCRIESAAVCELAIEIDQGDMIEGSAETGLGIGPCREPTTYYAFSAPADGVATIIAGADNSDAALVVSSGCATAELQGAQCMDDAAGSDPESVTRFLLAGDTIWIGVAAPGDHDLRLVFTETTL